jgi:organic radical activating enzyme
MKPCAWPNNYLVVESDGFTRSCCLETDKGAQIAPIKNGIINAFNDKKIILLQKDLSETGFSDKTRYACSRCEQVENHNETSLRQNSRKITPDRQLKVIQFKLSNKCQLACAHCGPNLSSTWAKVLKISPHVTNSFEITEDFLSELVSLLPGLDVIKFTGGEPFLDPNHWKILQHIAKYDRKHIKLEYITNGLIKPRYELWDGWKNVSCMVSVDGYEDTYEWFRRGAKWDELTTAVDELSRHSQLSIVTCITPWTIQSYNDTLNFWKYPITFQPVVFPKRTSFEMFPKKLALELANNSSAPYLELATEKGDMGFYRSWAEESDKTWNTVGACKKIYPWLYEENK